MTSRVRSAVAALTAAAFVLTACGDGDGSARDSADGAAPPDAAATCPDAPVPTGQVGPPTGVKPDLKTTPKIKVPKGPPPTELVVSDLVVGEGELGCTGQVVDMQYVGVTYADGKQFDASYDRGEPFTFQLGGGQVIAGWDQGIVGMRVGGRRQLVIPSDLAYGPQGRAPVIPPDAALVFVVDLVGVQE